MKSRGKKRKKTIAERLAELKKKYGDVPPIPIGRAISYEDWLKGRRFRREVSKLVAPGVIRRKSSSSDKRLKKLFNGERGLPFTPTEKL